MNKKEIIGIGLIIVLAFSLLVMGLNHIDKKKAEVICYKDFSTSSYQNGKIKIIEIENYSCEVINYAIENNLNLKWMATPMRRGSFDTCEKTWDRTFINSTETTGSNYTEYSYYSKGQLGKYYIENCLRDVLEVEDGK